MKKKRCLSMLLVAALVITLFPASAMAAGVEKNLTLEGNIDIVNPIYNIIVPTNLDFQVDSFGVFSEDTSSIVSTGYAVVNRSPVAVQIDINASLTAASSGALLVKDTAADVSTKDKNNKDPELYFEIQPAKAAPIVTAGTFNYTATAPGEENITYAAMTFVVTPGAMDYASGKAIDTTTGNSVSFAVKRSPNAKPSTTTPDEIEYTGNPATGTTVSDDAIAFKFAGKINPYAKWGTGDLANFKVIGEFSFNALTVEGFKDVQAKLDDTKGHGYLGAGSGGGDVTLDLGTHSLASKNSLSVRLTNKPASVTSVVINGQTLGALGYSYVPSTGVFTLVGDKFINGLNAGSYSVVITTSSGTVSIPFKVVA